jgi:hypothetical protein
LATALAWLVAGCAQVSPFSRAETEGPARVYGRAPASDFHSTAVASNQQERVIVKMPTNPDRDLRGKSVSIQPLMPPNVHEREDAKKPGAVGVVSVEESPQTTEEKNALLQIPMPPMTTPEASKEFEAAVLAYHYLTIGRHEEALKALRHYDDATQEFLCRVFPLLVSITKTPFEKMPANQLVALSEQLEGIRNFIREHCELVVSKMVYCKSINGFANYEPLPENHAFLARTDKRPGDLVHLYVELKNFASKETKEGDYLTKLTCSLELKDSQGERVWSHTIDKNDTTHRRSARVNDYYSDLSFYVPALPAGTYNLTIQVVDETIPDHRRVARKSQTFRVTPVANAATSR